VFIEIAIEIGAIGENFDNDFDFDFDEVLDCRLTLAAFGGSSAVIG